MAAVNHFCGDCGSRLAPGDRFCGQCGSRVGPPAPEAPPPRPLRPLQPPSAGNPLLDWLTGQWRRGNGAEPAAVTRAAKGLLLTNRLLLEELGLEAGPLVSGFVAARLRDAGVAWHVLDAGEELGRGRELGQYLQLLRQHRGALAQDGGKEPVPLLLLGSEEVVPMGLVEDQASAGNDSDIDTDLPYVLLEPDGLWESPLQDFQPLMNVGRLPLGMHFGPDALAAYVEACGRVRNGGGSPAVFGLSARCWREASQAVQEELADGARAGGLHLSPQVEAAQANGLVAAGTHWYYFNVHGSDADRHWFGQEGTDYPRAIAPGFFSRLASWNVVGVEACYGARFIGCVRGESCLLTALGSQTVAFAGSSRIAYGPASPPNGLADLVIRDFLQSAQAGACMGEAMNLGRRSVLAAAAPDPGLVAKTVLEFNLFGDPLVRAGAGFQAAAVRAPARPFFAGKPLPKVERLGQVQGGLLDQVRGLTETGAARIRDRLAQLLRRYPSLALATPAISRISWPSPMPGGLPTELLKFHFSAPSCGHGRTEVIAYCDAQGVLKQIIESKGGGSGHVRPEPVAPGRRPLQTESGN